MQEQGLVESEAARDVRIRSRAFWCGREAEIAHRLTSSVPYSRGDAKSYLLEYTGTTLERRDGYRYYSRDQTEGARRDSGQRSGALTRS